MIHKLPLTTGIIGIILAAASLYRWFILFYDPSNALFGIAIGLTLLYISYDYNWKRNIDAWKDKVEIRLFAHTSTKFGMEKEDMQKIAEGIEIE